MGPPERAQPLALEDFRVRAYRSILDSGVVPVFPLTALVGRQQSGKTSLVHALLGLDPDRPHPFDLERDWPRGTHRRRRAEHVVCSATFRVDERRLRVGRTYAGAFVVEAETTAGGESPPAMTPAASRESLEAVVLPRLPRFLFADHRSLLPGALAIEALADTGPDDTGNAGDAGDEERGVTALARLLDVVGADRAELRGGPDPRRVRQAGERIDELLAGRGWRHPLSLDVDRGRLLVFLETAGARLPLDEVSRELRFRLTLELRLAAAAGERGRAPVLLLDGPGRAFRREERPRMRAVLDRFVDAGVTVVYTARLPFDVELQHPEQVLVLEPGREGSMVARGSPGAHEQPVLRAALGMTGRTSFRVDDLNLVVEGPSDARILEALDAILRRSGEAGLPPDVNLAAAQGSHEVATVSVFLGQRGLGVVALLDSDEAGTAAREQIRHAARDHARMGRVEVLQLAQAAQLNGEAAIEDLFPTSDYLDVVREVCGSDAEGLISRAFSARVRADGNPAARLERAFEAKGLPFPKGKVTDALVARLGAVESVAELPPDMVAPVRHLMQALRAAAERLLAPVSGKSKKRVKRRADA